MHINFPTIDEGFIKNKVESGYYGNATEVVRDAVRRMRESDERHNRLLAALQKGEEDIAAGRYRAYTPELLAEIVENSHKKAAEGRKSKPDVTD